MKRMPKLISLIAVVIVVALIGFFNCPQVNGAKILNIVYQQQSHVFMQLGFCDDLLHRGHEVFIALASDNPNADSIRRTGVQVIHYQRAVDIVYPFDEKHEEKMAEFIFERQSSELDFVMPNVEGDCRALISDQKFINELKSLRFGLVVIDNFIVNPCYLLMPHYLGIPFISVSGNAVPFPNRLPALPSFYPNLSPGPYPVQIPAMDKFLNRLSNTIILIAMNVFLLPKLWGNTSLLQKYAPEIESWEQLMLRTEILLIENDYHLDMKLPLLPHAVEIAGCTAKRPKPLADNLEKIMTESGDSGVILASFGTAAYRMPSSIAIKFLEAFERLNETVLTRMAVPPGFKVPRNVHMQKWLPQNDLLGHPKLKLFISHCGSNSQYEALYHGVPMLGIPMFAEQGWNCGRARDKGIAQCLDLLEFTADQLYDHIRELIDNATYRTTVRRLSEIWRDQPMNCSEKAGFWINHVIKYGSKHLKSPATSLPLYQFLMLDVLAVLLLVLISILAVTIVVANKVVKFLRSIKGNRDVIRTKND